MSQLLAIGGKVGQALAINGHKRCRVLGELLQDHLLMGTLYPDDAHTVGPHYLSQKLCGCAEAAKQALGNVMAQFLNTSSVGNLAS
eukprot:CAMPEP_0180618574 /NCGR_PEP_ID=MMETSP1037_2-20121125/33644_1 /TAXON_ID=632150 /ORGANISM="Azadinium spinosum, Strain 3D9" /LENGTH=85 /DNA_ID=CAMNT_0022638605 /DNA_START=27 /DNA_END=282 /DNA_ORIENTATION=+